MKAIKQVSTEQLRTTDQIRLAVEDMGWTWREFAAKHAERVAMVRRGQRDPHPSLRAIHPSLLRKKVLGEVGMSTREAEEITDTLRYYGRPLALAWPHRSAA